MADRRTFEAAMEPLLPDVFRFIRLRTPLADAQDILQETMLAAWQGYEGFHGASQDKTWVLAIARRKVADHYRKAARRREELGREHCESVPGPDQEEQTAQRLTLEAAMGELTQGQRELCHLALVQRLRYEEVAQVLDIPVGTVKSRMSAVRTRLKSLLEGQEGEKS